MREYNFICDCGNRIGGIRLMWKIYLLAFRLVFNSGKEDILGKHEAHVRCVEYSYTTGKPEVCLKFRKFPIICSPCSKQLSQ